MTLLARLRTDTRAAHRALEDDLGFLPGTITPARYESVLSAFLGFHEPLEEALTASITAHALPWELTAGEGRLTADLRALGWSPERIASLPRSSAPDVPPLPALIGTLYVVEGAKLGGRVITRWVRDELGPAPVSFFAADGDARRGFRRFGVMAEAVLPARDATAACEAANRCFARFQEWLAISRDVNDLKAPISWEARR
ncbi:biliverdin-producing heme oxygenase [Lentzea sp. CC55]|uniref:biliverdin-producing heme oxygenase n=1 Tax=Lentzea sp. CC55 TaxID=2884909 RepID=UPI0027DFB925|nr:biliverdin-producing heme oxygenase [Lentzea sp. CC55]MCG8927814.1 biliverdin-producing heme oxygenase [Lentzea sp. CC55]